MRLRDHHGKATAALFTVTFLALYAWASKEQDRILSDLPEACGDLWYDIEGRYTTAVRTRDGRYLVDQSWKQRRDLGQCHRPIDAMRTEVIRFDGVMRQQRPPPNMIFRVD